MRQEWNDRMQEWKEKERQRDKWVKRQALLEQELKEEKKKASGFLAKLKHEEHDVEKLKGLSFGNFVHTLFGDKDEKLEKEKREAVEAKLNYDTAAAIVRDLEQQLDDAKRRILSQGNLEQEYQQLLDEKEKWIRMYDEEASRRLEQCSGKIADSKSDLKELKEALSAGRSLTYALEQAVEQLRSAKNWGTFDMLGGGMITTAIKHGKMDEAQYRIQEAQSLMRRFAKELRDVDTRTDMSLDIGGLLNFADYFFDGLLTDWMVQGKINSSLQQVEDKLREVSAIMNGLESDRRKAEREEERRIEEYRMILEKQS